MTKTVEDIENFIQIAEEMLERNELDTCINRLYIACENIAIIILQKFSIQFPKSHDKIANAVENLFKTGKINKNYSVTSRRLYELHMFSDYGRSIGQRPTKEELKAILKETKEFLKAGKLL